MIDTSKLESGYYWVIVNHEYSWDIAWFSKSEQDFLLTGNSQSTPAEWIKEIDPTPIKRKEL